MTHLFVPIVTGPLGLFIPGYNKEVVPLSLSPASLVAHLRSDFSKQELLEDFLSYIFCSLIELSQKCDRIESMQELTGQNSATIYAPDHHSLNLV